MTDRFNAAKCLIGATCIGALFLLFTILFDRWDAKRNPEIVSHVRYQGAKP